ncbi:MAG: methylated-DNA--[protein]-cysteine S-methyltransferase [Myxococcales bacterium]|nr:methylated-DNA--[protein]-cysteine S-methyltransferase [Myxococcales bacterium]
MPALGFALFDSPIGRCGVAWSPYGLTAVQLPEPKDSATRARLVARFPDAAEGEPPPDVKEALEHVLALLRGEARDLSAIALDMDAVPPFHRRVYEATRAIRPGETLSYGEIAARAGSPGAARAVGQALGRNPFAIVVPCHRVFAAGGRVGGFSAAGGITTKLRLLSLEEAHASGAAARFEGDGVLGYDAAEAVAHLRGADARMRALVDEVGEFRLRLTRTPSVFGALARAIVYQQLTGRAAATIFARVRALFPRAHEGPTAEQVARASAERLLGAGLSRSKMLSLRDLARKAIAGEIPELAEIHGMDDEQIIRRLTGVRGVGRWTVEMLLIFRLGRPDVFPVDDYGVRKGFAAMLGRKDLPSRAEMERRAARWRPYRSVASWYLWRAAEGAAPRRAQRAPARGAA